MFACAGAWNLSDSKKLKIKIKIKMGSFYIAECDGSGIVELLIKKVKESVKTGTKCCM